jgi:hypothetical protein
MQVVVKQDRWLCEEYILYIFQQGDLFSMAQAQLSKGGWTLKSIAGNRLALDYLLAADSDLLDNNASLIVHDA